MVAGRDEGGNPMVHLGPSRGFGIEGLKPRFSVRCALCESNSTAQTYDIYLSAF